MPDKTKTIIGTLGKHGRVDGEMEFLLNKYMERHPNHEGAVDPEDICNWAIDVGLYKPPKPPNPVAQLKKRFCRHLSHRYVTDPQNREVRTFHAVPTEEHALEGVKQGFLYYPLFTTEPEKIKLSLGVRRDGVRRRVIQIETDRLSYNENNTFGAVIGQMNFDFNTAAIESQMPTSYPESAPVGIDDEDDDMPS